MRCDIERNSKWKTLPQFGVQAKPPILATGAALSAAFANSSWVERLLLTVSPILQREYLSFGQHNGQKVIQIVFLRTKNAYMSDPVKKNFTKTSVEVRKMRIVRAVRANSLEEAEYLFLKNDGRIRIVIEDTLETQGVTVTNAIEYPGLNFPAIHRDRIRRAFGPNAMDEIATIMGYLADVTFKDSNGTPIFGNYSAATEAMRGYLLLHSLIERDEDEDSANDVSVDCACCSKNTREIGEYYMVTDAVWKAAGREFAKRMLCIECLEGRIQRELTQDDFPADIPINISMRKKSDLLQRRMGR
ncbi:hypothetical protein [Agrobacterium vitis]|uniref:Uncharacterized protein n=1 Tax=Agrobacterium vitis TaxID=373 RepID=A0AAE2R7V7_AGRVI|nr:hypothetical protein [Agrobacterium vitis]MBF2713196.1 hypothetical protein [Agrobacterium vitis]